MDTADNSEPGTTSAPQWRMMKHLVTNSLLTTNHLGISHCAEGDGVREIPVWTPALANLRASLRTQLAAMDEGSNEALDNADENYDRPVRVIKRPRFTSSS